MAVSIRFRRGGRRNRPFYRIVVSDSRSPRDGRFIETIGHYDPLKNPELFEIKRDRLLHWMSLGAKPTVSVKSMLSRKGMWKEALLEIQQKKSFEQPQTQETQ